MLRQGSFLGRKILGRPFLWSLGRLRFVEVWWHLHSLGAFRGSRSSSICLLDWRFALTLLQLSIVDGILYPSSIITQFSKRTNRWWQEPTIIHQKQILNNHVDLIFLIWPINHPRCLSLPHSENVSPTPFLVVSKSLKVTSIIVLKMNWSTNNSTNSFHTLVLLESKL